MPTDVSPKVREIPKTGHREALENQPLLNPMRVLSELTLEQGKDPYGEQLDGG